MSRGDQRERDRAKNQAKQQAKQKAAGKVCPFGRWIGFAVRPVAVAPECSLSVTFVLIRCHSTVW